MGFQEVELTFYLLYMTHHARDGEVLVVRLLLSGRPAAGVVRTIFILNHVIILIGVSELDLWEGWPSCIRTRIDWIRGRTDTHTHTERERERDRERERRGLYIRVVIVLDAIPITFPKGTRPTLEHSP